MFDPEVGTLKERVIEPLINCNTVQADGVGLFGKKITSMAWHPMVKNLLAVSSVDKVIKFIDASTGMVIMDLDIPCSAHPVGLTWSWDCRTIGWCEKASGDHTLHAWDVVKRELRCAVKTGMKSCMPVFQNGSYTDTDKSE